MSLSPTPQKRAAREFVAKWELRDGNEKEDTQSFWLEPLRNFIGTEDVTATVRFEQNTVNRGYIDAVIAEAKTCVEQKPLGMNLDKAETRQDRKVTPSHQPKAYVDSIPNSRQPDTIIVCDFNELRFYDMDPVSVITEMYDPPQRLPLRHPRLGASLSRSSCGKILRVRVDSNEQQIADSFTETYNSRKELMLDSA